MNNRKTTSRNRRPWGCRSTNEGLNTLKERKPGFLRRGCKSRMRCKGGRVAAISLFIQPGRGMSRRRNPENGTSTSDEETRVFRHQRTAPQTQTPTQRLQIQRTPARPVLEKNRSQKYPRRPVTPRQWQRELGSYRASIASADQPKGRRFFDPAAPRMDWGGG